MSDAIVRKQVGKMESPTFEETAFVEAPELSDAVVAIVTTAGLQKPGGKPWGQGDQSFRTFGKDEHDLILGHLSPNFDRTGFMSDMNVVYPVDRLKELAREGVIQGVADKHISFMGAQNDMLTTIRVDSGPAAARELKEIGANVVLLTPI